MNSKRYAIKLLYYQITSFKKLLSEKGLFRIELNYGNLDRINY